MTMRDRVIAALENCTDAEKCKDCPWAPCEEFDYPHSDYPDGLIKKALALLKAEYVVRCDECEYAGFGDCLLTAGAQLDGCLRGKRRQDNDEG